MERQSYLDNISAILIAYMIFIVHLTYFCPVHGFIISILRSLFYFFMAWFFFKSGMFFREKEIKAVVKSSAKRLLIPWAVFNAIGIIVMGVKAYYESGFSTIPFLLTSMEVVVFNEAIWADLPLWFLLSLFVVRIMFAILHQCRINAWVVCAMFLTATVLIHYTCYVSWRGMDNIPITIVGHHLPKNILLIIGNISFGSLFYTLGYILQNKQYHRVALIIACLVFAAHFLYPMGIDTRIIDTPNMPLAIIYCLAGIIVADNIFKRYLNCSYPIWTYIGRNSMTYYIVHYVLFYLAFNVVLSGHNFSGTGYYLFFCFIAVLLLYGSDRLFNLKALHWMIGK